MTGSGSKAICMNLAAHQSANHLMYLSFCMCVSVCSCIFIYCMCVYSRACVCVMCEQEKGMATMKLTPLHLHEGIRLL